MDQRHISAADKIKGDIAESLVKQLFDRAKIPYLRFGFEHQLLDFTKRTSNGKYQKSDASERLRLAPDFLIRNKFGKLDFVEVKYWQQGRPHPDELDELNLLDEYWSAKLVVVSYNTNTLYNIPRFQVVNAPYRRSEDRNFTESYSIENESAWGIKLSDVREFCVLVRELYSPFTDWDKGAS